MSDDQAYSDGLARYLQMLAEEADRRDEKNRQRLARRLEREFERMRGRAPGEQQDAHVTAWHEHLAAMRRAAE